MEPGALFREKMEQFLAGRPVQTENGEVFSDTRHCEFGFPGGRHEPADFYVYKRKGTGLEMLFAFVRNFWPNDLFTKIVPAGDTPASGEGATLQFNADLCIGDGDELTHYGGVTVIKSVGRRDLVAAIENSAGDAWSTFKPLAWPVNIGTAASPSSLLDKLFLYSYCIEQAKRTIRKKSLLRPLGL